jgi:putative SOS response-associated peptidase YedK
MCYFNGQKVTRDEYIRLRHLEKLVAKYNFLNRPVINGFDFGNTAVLRPIKGEEDFELVPLEWGFLPDPLLGWPFWETREQVNLQRRPHKDVRGNWKDGLNFLNAMSEEILKPGKVYRKAALDRRCLILSTGYYEWRHLFPLNKRTGEPRKTAVKYPYRIGVKNKSYFWLAAVWQQWVDADTGEVVDSCSMATTKAGMVNKQIHNSKERMPTMLNDDLAFDWVFENLNEKKIQEIASWQMPWQDISFYTLGKDFLNSNDPLRHVPQPDVPPILNLDTGNEVKQDVFEAA